MSQAKLSPNNLKMFLNRAQRELNRGERVPVNFTTRLHEAYLNYQMAGKYPDLVCFEARGSYYLGRIK